MKAFINKFIRGLLLTFGRVVGSDEALDMEHQGVQHQFGGEDWRIKLDVRSIDVVMAAQTF